MNQKILVNGNFLCRSLTGIERFAFEILKNIDLLLTENDDWAIFVPVNSKHIPEYKNIKIIFSEKPLTSFPKWDIFTFKNACKKLGRTGLNFSNTAPFGKYTGFAFIHDIYGYDCPGDFTTFRSKLIRYYSIIHAKNIVKNAKKIFTVSDFSKKQILSAFKSKSENIFIIPNGWDHFKSVTPDDSVFDKHKSLIKGTYYFTLGSLQKRKNLKWIAEYARKHPEDTFAVSGKIVSGFESDEIGILNNLNNVVLIGYVTDEEIKSLMMNCKAFVFPSLYEGFGIPPLEALSCGAKIIIANTASLPEIYKNTAVYLNVNDTDKNLSSLSEVNTSTAEKEIILDKYTYANSAKLLYSAISTT